MAGRPNFGKMLVREVKQACKESKERLSIYKRLMTRAVSTSSLTPEEWQALLEECQELVEATQAECEFLESQVP